MATPVSVTDEPNGNRAEALTASAVRGTMHHDPSSRYHAWPTDRSTDEVIAERMLMSALRNYRRAKQGGGHDDFKTHDQMSDIECGFYENAVRTAYDAIWGHR